MKKSHVAPIAIQTIDPEGATDLDDGFKITANPDGTVTLLVCIANPSDVLYRAGDSSLEQALQRERTQYFADGGKRSMLPRWVEDRASLRLGETRKALCVEWTQDVLDDVAPRNVQIHVLPVKSVRQWSYQEVAEFLADAENPDKGELLLLQGFALASLAKRRGKGALAVYDAKKGVYMTGEGTFLRKELGHNVIGHVMVQELMIATNEVIARWCEARGVHAVWRTHAPSTEQSPAFFADLIQKALEGGDDEALGALKAEMGCISQKATYATEAGVHWGLASSSYMHATSPLRRIADLVTQMQLLAYLRCHPLPFSPNELGSLVDNWNQGEKEEERHQRAVQADDQRTLRLIVDVEHEVAGSARNMRRAISIHLKDPASLSHTVLLRLLEQAQELNTPIASEYYKLVAPDVHPELRRFVLSHIVKHPRDGAGIINSLHQTGYQGLPAFNPERLPGRPDHTPMFKIKVGDYTCYSAQKKTVQHQARSLYLLTLGEDFGLIPEAWVTMPDAQVESPTVSAPVQVEGLPSTPSGQSVAALNSWSMKTGVQVEYRFSPSTDGAGWVCLARLGEGGEELQALAPRKKVAQHKVAHALALRVNTDAESPSP